MDKTHSNNTYSSFAPFYDLYAGKFKEDLEFYKSYCQQAESILEVGCGTGRILQYLLNLGHRIHGIDISTDMLEIAQEKLKEHVQNGKLILANHDFNNNTLNTKFDVVIISFYTFNYILDNPKKFLSNILKSIKHNGILLIDLF